MTHDIFIIADVRSYNDHVHASKVSARLHVLTRSSNESRPLIHYNSADLLRALMDYKILQADIHSFPIDGMTFWKQLTRSTSLSLFINIVSIFSW